MSWSFLANREAPWNSRGGRRATFDEAKWARFSPNDNVYIAVMGIRSRGGALAEGFAKLPKVNVATICDIDENLLPKAVAAGDFRFDQRNFHRRRGGQ